ncbi:MAG: SH3 domain-containing protein [Planctomycetaceae bacterium]
MRVAIMILSVACYVAPATLFAAQTQFPYQAVVHSDGVVVRSGPGERYDPTMKLSSGQQITVHRHDPGGWFMISPPPGSFSWINAGYVEATGDGRGVVKAPSQGDGLPPRVVVWIGSQFTNEHKYFGRQLASGDEVTIIGEEAQPTDKGPVTFYKIEPPRLEYRWVKGDFVRPLSDAGGIAPQNPVKLQPFDAAAAANDPFAGPAFVAKNAASPPGFPVQRETTLLERELDRAIDTNAVAKAGPDAAQLDQARTELFQLDDQLRAMLAQGPGQWRLDEMEEAYRVLQASATPGVRGMIETRLETIASRRPIKAEYDTFVAITTRTEQRDAELLSLQNSNVNGIPVGPSAVSLGIPQPVDGQSNLSAGVPIAPFANGNAPPESGGDITPVPSGPTPPADLGQLDGAGIVSRLPVPRPGVPQHILVAPDGRLLAYLLADRGINLDAYLGQSVGVIGRRSQEAQLRSDLIIVQKLTIVRLQP